MPRDGQAALEYLVTYGWGLVAVIVVIGAMSYFGFLTPSRYLPARCDFGVQLQCADFQLMPPNGAGQQGRIRLIFFNSFGDDINITRMWYGEHHIGDVIYNSPSGWVNLNTGPVMMNKGNISREFRIRMPAGVGNVIFELGDRYSMPVTVEFQRDLAGSPVHNVTGEIFATVES